MLRPILDHLPATVAADLWIDVCQALNVQGTMNVEVHPTDDSVCAAAPLINRQMPESGCGHQVIDYFYPN